MEVNPDDTATQRLKERQFELIQNNHPKEDWDYQTWINNVDDVKTYQEAVDDDRAGTPDFDDADIDQALKTGRVRVYSSHRIRIGTFVTPSRIEAESYAGSKNVYSKTVPLTDMAWIDSIQGQFAPTSGEIEARDTVSRRRMSAEERKNTPPKLGDADTVFADRGTVNYMRAEKAAYDEESASIKEQIIRNQETLNKMAVVSKKTVPTNLRSKPKAAEWAINELNTRPDYVDRRGLGKVDVSQKAIREAVKYADTPAEKAALVAAPDVIKRGIEDGGHNVHKSRRKATLTIAAPVELNGQRGSMAVVINLRGNKYYAHRILTPDGSVFEFEQSMEMKNDTERESQRGVTVSGSLANATSSVFINIIRSSERESQEKTSGRASTRVESRAEAERKEAEAYRDAYASIYDFERMSVDEIERLLTEEIAADAYAGLNWFSGDAPVQEAVRAETERNAPARRAEAQQETTGPPENKKAPRFSLNVYSEQQKENWKRSKKIIVYENAEQLKNFVEKAKSDNNYVSKIYFGTVDGLLAEEIMNETGYDFQGKNVTLRADNVRKIFKDHGAESTEAPRGQRPITADDFGKIPEVIGNPDSISESEYFGRPAAEFKKTIDNSRITVFAVDSGGSSLDLYVQTMYAGRKKGSIADTANASALTQTPEAPAGTASFIEAPGNTKTGVTVQDGVTRGPKASSDAIVYSDTGDSQEKSSGRASVAGMNARTADRAALRRAEALEKSGTDNETIRQETGWYRGMDGQWRFEIDDSGAAFSRSGEAKYRADNADYARYTQLMNRMLTGELTEAEHAELLGLDKKNGSTKKELARRIDEGNATLRDIMQHNALFEAYPEIAETKVKFADMPSGTAGSYNRETNTITLDTKLKYDANEALDALMHEVQHRVQAAEGFTSGTNPGYWNRAETYDKAAEKYRDNRARLLNGLSDEDRALYNEYRSIDREMGAMFDGSVLYDESRMDTLEKRSDELYKELYGKEWFGKLNRYDRILGDAGEAVKEFYRNTAGEIEARDTAARRRMSAEERKNTQPELGDADTVFADGSNISAYVDVDADGNPVTVVQTDKNVFDKANKSAYANIAKKLIMSKYAGQTLPLGENDLARITSKSGGEYGYPSTTIDIGTEEYDAKMRAAAELHNLLEYSTYDHWAPDTKNHKEATLGFDYYKTVFAVNGKIFEGLVNVANSENGRVFYDITKIREVPDTYGKYAALLARSSSVFENLSKEASDYTRKHVAPLARSSSTFGNLSTSTIRSTEGKSQGKSSGRASVEVSGINNRTAAELRREYERRMQEYQKATQRDDQSYPYIDEMKWIQAAERRLAELGDGKHRRRTVGSTKRKRTYEPIQAVGEYTERLVRMESALEAADTAVMEEGKNRYEARITEEDGCVYAYCGQRKTRFMSIHSSAPQSVGSAAASAVHVQLPVSFFTERSVVEHGQCISVKTITHAAVFSVQPFASSIPLIAEAESVRFSVPSAI